MELEFDKEIDALLRKAHPPGAAPAGGHLDADIISAFAEGAVPAAAHKAYTAHFADCDRCRKALSQVALLNEPRGEKVMTTTAAAAPAARPIQTAVPWYRPLFRTPGLAVAMGVLVVAFAGVLVYLVTKRSPVADSTVAMEQRVSNANAAIPYAGIDTNTNTNDATAAPQTATSALTNTISNATRSANSSANTPAGAATRNLPVGGATVDGLAAPAPPPAAESSSSLPINGRRLESLPLEKPKDESMADTAERLRDDKVTTRSEVLAESDNRAAAMAKRAPGGPYRAQSQNQAQLNNQAGAAPVTRRVGGKTFRNTDGAWYDSAYHGQPTTNVARGTDQFNKLDSGLRSIANELTGVVVVVWKDKAFRIQ